MIALLQLRQHSGNRLRHFAFQMAIHFTFKLFFQFRNALTGHGGKDIQQVRDTRFLFHIITHYRRLVGVSDRTFDFLHYRFRIFQQADHVITVIVRFGHFLRRLQQRHHARAGFWNKRFRYFENITIQPVKTLGDIAAQFQMLLLIFAYRHQIGLVQQDVCRHQHRVIKQAGVNVFRIARRFIFKLRHTAQLAEIGIAV
ncbi:Uncharacterised protein [Salmonella enterica subsp. enterica serovar Bovismorbificans]|uniref:Uncharacterized protein n=1 Tax=Salmonella enterica subsp. enterica serovar Bovismorbificans TaxID=58097 RepID=A0A655ECL5_SALET|nr:Uncharacterised protein [Salmonella enterica subsp. enterica serovar Bovismorbificans]